ncbi:cytidine and deoxycytidylate deaminase zinc-binding region domain-containing protein [Cystoisospora suis]|uniref:Cytidine and deoxycytidylate deaminase zinc-binding region domain-containing protein n=1 Tax=Cystoisospora suis TaxID=483139 RepID=A0A2C6LA16_9APIC|nr:cytidine and deoxycytidylate deaminase zinc-binding region domain-containing protein [Cystoisospora suis]
MDPAPAVAAYRLMRAAKAVAVRAHAPYSGVRQGCAVGMSNGNIYTGCSFENVAYPCSVCAVHSAISSALLHETGDQKGPRLRLAACAVAELVPPQGRNIPAAQAEDESPVLTAERKPEQGTIGGCCRQWLKEFEAEGQDIDVVFSRFTLRLPEEEQRTAGGVTRDGSVNEDNYKELYSRTDTLRYLLPAAAIGRRAGVKIQIPDPLLSLSETSGHGSKASLFMNDGSPVAPYLPELLRRAGGALRQAMCAEQTAIATAIAGGARGFTAVLVLLQNRLQCYARPCGKCRQVILEAAMLGGRDGEAISVYACRSAKGRRVEMEQGTSLPVQWEVQKLDSRALLPYAFDSLDVAETAWPPEEPNV